MKRLLYFLGFGLILLTIGGCSMYRGQTEETAQEEMTRIVKSEEAKEAVERTIKNIEAAAFTDKGVIQSYKIDYDSVEHNPMGGIMFKVYINDTKNLYLDNTLSEKESGLTISGSGISPDLSKLLKENKENE